MARNVLITGGAGFIGPAVARMLCARGDKVTVVDNLTVGSRDFLAGIPVEFVEGDILDAELMLRLTADKDGVIHLAAQTGVPLSVNNPRRDMEMNVAGTLNVLEGCRHHPVTPPRIVFASSNAPLGRQPPPASEDKAPLPVSPYGASKLAGEGYMLAYQGTWGVPSVILRFANVYGPGAGHKSSVVAKFIKDIRTTGKITIDGTGEQTRDFIYIEDLARAIVLSLDSQCAGEVFQIATGVETTINQLAEKLLTLVGQPVDVSRSEFRQGDVLRNFSSVSKAGSVLGWHPQMDLDDGLRRTLDWFVANGK